MNTKTLFAVIVTAALMLTSCGTTSSTTNPVAALAGQTSAQSEAYTSGQSAGVALRALYTQYKTNGKIEMNNLTTLTNIITLSSSCQMLKTATKGSGAYSDFSKGLIAGSSNIINTANSETVMNTLTNMLNQVDTSALNEVVSKGNSTVNNTLNSVVEKGSNAVNNAVEKGNEALNDATDKGVEIVESATEIANSVNSLFSLFK